jgi:hypothetical protein
MTGLVQMAVLKPASGVRIPKNCETLRQGPDFPLPKRFVYRFFSDFFDTRVCFAQERGLSQASRPGDDLAHSRFCSKKARLRGMGDRLSEPAEKPLRPV